ncbi:MAG: hypothetical protein HC836_46190 [Richelia sp. RM2_1_2]|nr:hypothetical protein [Richelia sp. RM2_1_2]
MTNGRLLATVDFGSAWKDNDYLLYENGLVVHTYDENDFAYNLRERCEVSEMTDDLKESLIEACAPEDKQLAKSLLYPEV